MKNRVEKVTALALAGLIGGALSISPPLYAQDSTAGRELHQRRILDEGRLRRRFGQACI
jgi:hypothetical protein